MILFFEEINFVDNFSSISPSKGEVIDFLFKNFKIKNKNNNFFFYDFPDFEKKIDFKNEREKGLNYFSYGITLCSFLNNYYNSLINKENYFFIKRGFLFPAVINSISKNNISQKEIKEYLFACNFYLNDSINYKIIFLKQKNNSILKEKIFNLFKTFASNLRENNYFVFEFSDLNSESKDKENIYKNFENFIFKIININNNQLF